jgi:peptidoglycan/xylan/chitin deacetylase (PgdA/CDA1 family)
VFSLEFVKRLPGQALWHTPNPFGVAAMVRRGYTLRCVLFHDVSEQPSSFTTGLDVSMTPLEFEKTIRFLVRHYTPVSLDEALQPDALRKSTSRPLLVTFDDAYASVVRHALPICQKYGVPVVFFVSARFVDNQQIALDNLVCHVVNSHGYSAVESAASEVVGATQQLASFRQIFGRFIPSLSLTARRTFYDALAAAAHVDPGELAREAGLYVTSQQLAEHASATCEIGSHTYTHVHGRVLDESGLAEEIDWNRSLLESVTAKRVRAFSVPYGSSADLPPRLARHLADRGYDAVFLVERLMNTAATSVRRLHRVSIRQSSDAYLFSELELLPRLRALRSDFRLTPEARPS